VFGEVVSDADQSVVNQIAQGDKIISVTIEGDIAELAELMEGVKPMIDKWNAALDANFPKLPKVSKA
jgi:peptidyl-prolyl cis-trans isomerase B (cyclophilin B)